ncbi:hypothetical protein IQ219_14350 [Synechocystis sp. LEGE 06083]|uniref:hypothetical protein n=1 Tax=Synechocystis sp. LEGE 06083 TaxID=915336 RepID=UPI00187EF26C|nr:hypothetical protein [Synechocystis sp. LEGE 06083]MBE9196456.1 hypothetical protein [Synechocystis sp. LEGE 06083]
MGQLETEDLWGNDWDQSTNNIKQFFKFCKVFCEASTPTKAIAKVWEVRKTGKFTPESLIYLGLEFFKLNYEKTLQFLKIAPQN